MARLVANLLLAVFSFGLIAPTFEGAAESNLPACCRRDGKHHCAMTGSASHSGDAVGFSAAKQKCPLYPQHTAPTPGKSFIPVAASSLCLTPQQAPVFSESLHPVIRIAAMDRQRGPPTLS